MSTGPSKVPLDTFNVNQCQVSFTLNSRKKLGLFQLGSRQISRVHAGQNSNNLLFIVHCILK